MPLPSWSNTKSFIKGKYTGAKAFGKELLTGQERKRKDTIDNIRRTPLLLERYPDLPDILLANREDLDLLIKRADYENKEVYQILYNHPEIVASLYGKPYGQQEKRETAIYRLRTNGRLMKMYPRLLDLFLKYPDELDKLIKYSEEIHKDEDTAIYSYTELIYGLYKKEDGAEKVGPKTRRRKNKRRSATRRNR